MAIDVRKGKGTQLKRGGTAVTGITNLKPPGVTNPEMEITDLDSTWEEFDSTIPKGGAVTATLNFDPAVAMHLTIRQDCIDGTLSTWTVVIPAKGANPAKTYSFSARVTGFDHNDVDAKGKHQVPISLMPTGAITIA
jgi:hypothetical protein